MRYISFFGVFLLIQLLSISCVKVNSLDQKASEKFNALKTDKIENCSIDFNNFTFDLGESYGKFSVKNGSYNPPADKDGVIREIGVSVSQILYADLTQDSIPEAIVVLDISPDYRLLQIFDIQTDNPKLLWSIMSGDRANKGFRRIFVDNNTLIIESYESQTWGQCCPKSYNKTFYRWNGSTFDTSQVEKDYKNTEENARFFPTSSQCGK